MTPLAPKHGRYLLSKVPRLSQKREERLSQKRGSKQIIRNKTCQQTLVFPSTMADNGTFSMKKEGIVTMLLLRESMKGTKYNFNLSKYLDEA